MSFLESAPSWSWFDTSVLLFSYMEPTQNVTESVIAPLKKVTPISKYLAMALFIILPFLGGWIGYTYAPEKVVDVVKATNVKVEDDIKETPKQDNLYEVNFSESVPSRQFLPDDQVFGDYYVHQAEMLVTDKRLQLINLKTLQLQGATAASVRTVDNKVLTYLGTEYQQGISFRYVPSPNGKHIFIDGSDECECNVRNEVILTWIENSPTIIPLPNVSEFKWSDEGDKYIYTEVVDSPEVCEGVTGEPCLPYTYRTNLVGNVSDFKNGFLFAWDGKDIR